MTPRPCLRLCIGALVFALGGCAKRGVTAAAEGDNGLPAWVRPQFAHMRSFSFPTRDMGFETGFRMLLQEDASRPMVAVVLALATGSAQDPPGKEGLAHVVEHLVFQGATDGRTRRMDVLGGLGWFNAYTTHDLTMFVAEVPDDPEVIDRTVLQLASVVTAPLRGVREERVAREVDVVRNELWEGGERPEVTELHAALTRQLFFSDHPYARPVGGTERSLGSLTIADALAFVRARYQPARAALAIVGRFDRKALGDHLAKRLPAELTDGPAGKPPSAVAGLEAPPMGENTTARLRGVTETPEVYLGWTLPGHVGVPALRNEVFVSLVSGAVGGVEHEGLEGVGCALTPSQRAATITCRARLTDVGHATAVTEALLEAAEKTAQKLDENLFALSREIAGVRTALELDSVAVRAIDLARQAVIPGVLDVPSRIHAMQELAAPEIQALAKRTFARDRARVVVIEPGRPRKRPAPVVGPALPGTIASSVRSAPGAKQAPVTPTEIGRLITSPEVTESSLANGLRVVAVRLGRVPVASVGLVVPWGDVHTRRFGTATLAVELSLRSMMAEALEWLVGGGGARRVAAESTAFAIRGPAGSLDQLMRLLAVQASRVAVAKEPATRLRASLARASRQPEWIAREKLGAMLFPDHPLARVFPRAEDLADVSPDEIVGWFSSHVRPDDATLVVVGDIDPRQATMLAGSVFGAWKPRGQAPARPGPAALPRVPGSLVVTREEGPQVAVHLGCRLPAVAKGDDVAHQLLASYLANRIDSGVRDFGASYGAQVTTNVSFTGDAALVLETSVAAPHLERVLALLTEWLGPGATRALDPAELDAVEVRGARLYGLRYSTVESATDYLLDLSARGLAVAPHLASEPARWARIDPVHVETLLGVCRKAPQLVLVGPRALTEKALAGTSFAASGGKAR